MTPLITVTPAALAELRVALAAVDDPDVALRAAARRADDGGIEYGMGLDEAREQDERVALDDVVTVLVSVASRDLIAGTAIDYVEVAPGEMGFIFYKPEAAQASAPAGEEKSCGCGKGGCGAADR